MSNKNVTIAGLNAAFPLFPLTYVNETRNNVSTSTESTGFFTQTSSTAAPTTYTAIATLLAITASLMLMGVGS